MATDVERAAQHTAHHFQDLEQQATAARLGMWIFLGTEVLLFGGLFVGYFFYRSVYPVTWERASMLLNRPFGTIETLILVTSSFFVASAILLTRHRRKNLATLLIFLTMCCGVAFLIMHGFEYAHEAHEGELPGPYYHHDLALPGIPLFYALYFLMTGLHSIHVIIGVCVLGFLGVRTFRGHYDDVYHVGIELGGLYWHLVDVIWIFLYPLFYLV